MNKTDEEIKKGLACCNNDFIPADGTSRCSHCPYDTGDEHPECADILHMDALADIQRLEMLVKPNEQVRWERDVAIDQLKQLGIGFGEKIEVQVPKWISVNDPPKEKGYYLVTVNYHGHRFTDTVYFRGKSHWAKNEEYITHWMHLPDPAEGDDIECSQDLSAMP